MAGILLLGIPAVSGVLQTLTLENTDGSVATPSESYVTFGLSFKKGDVPSNRRPKIQRADTSAQLPAQFDLRRTWSDGSLRWCECSLVAPSIAGGGTLSVRVRSEVGAYNNTASRVLSDITGATTLNLALANVTDFNGVAEGSGAWAADFDTASAVAGNTEVMKSGPICVQWRTWMYFKDGATPHAHLGAWFYATAWTKQSDATLACISHITMVYQGWIGVASPTKYFYDASYKDAGSTIRQFDGDKTFTVANLSTDQITCTAHGRKTGDPVTVANSGGALPAGLAAGTVYYVLVVDANTLSLHTSGPGSQEGTSRVNITDNGTGTQTLEFRIFHHHNSFWWSCGTDGLQDWTSSEATIHVKQDVAYLKSTGLFPPYDLTVTVSPSDNATPSVYTPFAAGLYRLGLNATGEAEHIGPLPAWCARAFITQEKGYAQDARVNALLSGGLPIHFRNEATGKIPTLRGSSAIGDSGDYAGLGTNKRDTYAFAAGVKSSDVVAWAGDHGGWVATTGFDGSHHPQGVYYSASIEGGAHFRDALILDANHALMSINAGLGTGYSATTRAQRLTSGHSYNYGLLRNTGQTRAEAWRLRSLVAVANILPDDWVETPYFDDVLSGNFAYNVAYIAAQSTPFTTVGHWYFKAANTEVTSGWMHNWICCATAWAYKVHELPDALTFINHIKKVPVGFADGTFPCLLGSAAYRYSAHKSRDANGDFADWADIGISVQLPSGQGGSMTASAATNVFTKTHANAQWTINDGDRVKFPETNDAGGDQTLPGNITANQWYYTVETSGITFKVSLTLGGAAVDLSSDGGSFSASWRPSICPTTWNDNSPQSYLPIDIATLTWMDFSGVPDVSAARVAVAAKQIADFSTDPTYAFSVS